MAGLTGNTVTIFREGTRIATTVLVEGKRAVGTQAADNVIEQVLKKKMPYYGQADVVGALVQTGYLPLFDAQGNAVGMLYTGADQELINETVEALSQKRIPPLSPRHDRAHSHRFVYPSFPERA